jgi:NAD+ kinase
MHARTPTHDSAQTTGRPRVALVAAGDRADIAAEAARLAPLIERHTTIVCTDLAFDVDLSAIDADLVIVLGGDGSILRAAMQMGRCQLPVVGVNLGKLGFLADLQPDEFLDWLPALAEGFARGGDHLPRIVEHLMFECHVTRDGVPTDSHLGLNEVAVLAGPPFALVDIQLYVDAELVTTYSCDGLIVSTPVGSTAHSLSAGGPILRKDLQAFVISPISPHTLTNRPVVDSADRIYELVAPAPHAGTTLVVDGRVLCPLTAQDRVRVQRSEAKFQLVEAPGHSDYRTLRDKLGWGGKLKMNG